MGSYDAVDAFPLFWLGKNVCVLLPPSLGPVIYVAVWVCPKYSILGGMNVGAASETNKKIYVLSRTAIFLGEKSFFEISLNIEVLQLEQL